MTLTQDDLKTIQTLQQQLQAVMIEKDTISLRWAEIDKTLEELNKIENEEVFRIYGRVMVKKKKSDVIDELNSEKETLEIRLKTLERTENKIIEKLKEYEKKMKGWKPYECWDEN